MRNAAAMFAALCAVALALAFVLKPVFAVPVAEPAVVAEKDDRPKYASVVKVLVGQGHGSGVHIGNGYVLTAAHVVKEGQAIQVKSSIGSVQEAELLWSNAAHDVALLQIKMFESFAASELDCRTPSEGEAISAKGNPRDIEFITVRGYVAGHERKIGPWRVGVPVDLTLIGGMSGGPIFASDGRVVGITVGHMVVAIGFSPSWTRLGVIVPGSAICGVMGRGA